MKIQKIIKSTLIASILLSSTAYADGHYYYEDEGQLLFKAKGVYSDLDSTRSTFTTSKGSATTSKDLVSAAYGIEGSVSYFYSAHWATELSAGLQHINVRKSEFNKIAASIGENGGTLGKKDINIVPVSGIMQFHIAPYGAIRPYLGVGYSGTYVSSRSKNYSLDSGHGLVLQAGVDFVTRNEHYFTLEVKKYNLRPKLTLEKSFLDPTNESLDRTSSKMKLDPLTIALGFGFKL